MAQSALMQKMLKSGAKNSMAAVLSESKFFNDKAQVTTDLPVLNVAFTGELDGGLVSGLTLFAGESKSFKTLMGLYCLRAYLKKYPEAIAIIYDSEFGITPEYLAANEIDLERVIHVPVEHIEELKFDAVSRLTEVNRGDKVFVMVDSLGLGSKKELEDAIAEKSVADMTRAKALRSFLRVLTPMLTMKDIPCVAINHTYKTMEMYSKDVIGGGTAPMYFSNQVFIITKSKDQSGEGAKKVLNGFDFTIKVVKSRFVREDSKLSFNVSFENGINKWSAMHDLAILSGDVVSPKQGYYDLVDTDTGEILTDKPVRGQKGTECAEILGVVMKRAKFREFVRNRFKLGQGLFVQEDTSEDQYFEED